MLGTDEREELIAGTQLQAYGAIFGAGGPRAASSSWSAAPNQLLKYNKHYARILPRR